MMFVQKKIKKLVSLPWIKNAFRVHLYSLCGEVKGRGKMVGRAFVISIGYEDRL